MPFKPGDEERKKFEERLKGMGILDPNRIYTERDLAPGPGHPLRRQRRHRRQPAARRALLRPRRAHQLRGDELREHIIRFIDTVHLDGSPDVVVEF